MCTFLKGDYERYKVKKEKQLADGGHMGRIIGIDLGTTNSAAAVWENGESHLIPNAFGDYLTPRQRWHGVRGKNCKGASGYTPGGYGKRF